MGINQFSQRVGLYSVLGKMQLSEAIGVVVYILILIPILISSLNTLKLEAITAPASKMLETLLLAVPLVFAAILVLVLSYAVGKVLSELVAKFLESVGFNNILTRLGLSKGFIEGQHTPSETVGLVILITIMLFAELKP